MNIQTAIKGELPRREDAETALAVLKSWAVRAGDEELADLDPDLGHGVGEP